VSIKVFTTLLSLIRTKKEKYNSVGLGKPQELVGFQHPSIVRSDLQNDHIKRFQIYLRSVEDE